MKRITVLEWFHALLPFLLCILSLHSDGTLLLFFQIANKVQVVCVLDSPTGLRQLTCWGSLLRAEG